MRYSAIFPTLVLACCLSSTAIAADKLKAVSTFRGFWDTTMIEFGKEKGIFAAEGIDLDLIFMQGGGIDVLQTVIAGSADIGIGTGTGGAMAAIYKGAPVVIVGSEFTGAGDVFFYSKTSSQVATFKDLNGRKLGIAHQGATTQAVASLLGSRLNAKIDFVVTGGPPATMAQVMTGQVDAGWSVFPIGMDKVAAGELRILATGNDAPGVANENTRVIVANRAFAQKSEVLLQRFFKAYAKVLDWAYTTDEALQKYASLQKMSLEIARDTVKKGYPREALATNRVGTSDLTMSEMVRNKVIDKPLTKQQVTDMFKLVPVLHK